LTPNQSIGLALAFLNNRRRFFYTLRALLSFVKNLVRFSSPSAIGTNLRGKYQHFGLYLFVEISRSYNSVYKYENWKNLNLKGLVPLYFVLLRGANP
jgi:hypothetical protein